MNNKQLVIAGSVVLAVLIVILFVALGGGEKPTAVEKQTMAEVTAPEGKTTVADIAESDPVTEPEVKAGAGTEPEPVMPERASREPEQPAEMLSEEKAIEEAKAYIAAAYNDRSELKVTESGTVNDGIRETYKIGLKSSSKEYIVHVDAYHGNVVAADIVW
jgi:uncharacterized membrane protein YkoI